MTKLKINKLETAHQNRLMAKFERFWQLDGQRCPVLKFDGQNQT
jgi:hypothetical protein